MSKEQPVLVEDVPACGWWMILWMIFKVPSNQTFRDFYVLPSVNFFLLILKQKCY